MQSKNIISVKVYVEKDYPKGFDDIFRLDLVEVEYSDKTIKELDELVDNAEFHCYDEIQKYVCDKLKINSDIVEIINPRS